MAAFGLPAVIVRPGGRVPESTVHVFGAVPPVAVTVELALPMLMAAESSLPVWLASPA